jgi:hypothetical protein
LARGEGDRRDEVGGGWETFAAHEEREEGGGFPAGAAGVERDAGKGRWGEGAEDLVVVHAEDGDLLGDGEADAATGFEHLLAAVVVAGENGDGFRERGEPRADGTDFRVGVRRTRRAGGPARAWREKTERG